MCREQVQEKARLRGVWKRFDFPEPAGRFQRVPRQELAQVLATLDAIDRLVDSISLFVERFDRVQVVICGLACSIELRHRIGNGEHGFLHCRIKQVAVTELHPGHQGTAVIVDLGISPANAE